jgi:hypothetical protein
LNPTADTNPPIADNNPPVDEDRATGTHGNVVALPTSRNDDEKPSSPASRSSSVSVPKIDQNSASRKKAASRSKLLTKPQKLHITKSRSAEQESWTIKTGRGRPYFRVRIADSGYRVQLCWTDTKPREPYLAYLSAQEWRAAKRRSLADFTTLIIAKLEERKNRDGNSAAKIDSLISRVRTVLH